MIAIVDTGGANLASVSHALRRLGCEHVFTSDAERIVAADKVILPGVGAAQSSMQRLRDAGLVDVLRKLQQPLLGICLGMQLLFEASEEGGVPCLGLLPGSVTEMPLLPGITIPHMGWNRVQPTDTTTPLLERIEPGSHFYFVHSYCAPMDETCVGVSEHGTKFPAMVQRGNIFGVQFHPERSAVVGARLLENFIGL